MVSGDIRLQDAARRRGAIALPSISFAQQMTTPAPRHGNADDEPRLSAEEVAAWERLFQKRSGRDG